jgi:parvulin-like peptidyl-prolyl isomerase
MAKKDTKTKKDKTSKDYHSKGKLTFTVGILLILIGVALILSDNQTALSSPTFDSPALIINGEEVSLNEVRTIYATYTQPVTRELLLQTVINDIIEYRLLLQDARNKGYTVSSEEVDEAFQTFLTAQQLTREQFVARLDGTGTTLDDYRLRIQEDLLVNKILTEIDPGVSNTEVISYYQENIADFLIPEAVVVRQITLSPDYTDQQLTQVANSIFNELQTGDFCEIAQRYSLDKTCNSYRITPEDAFPAFVTAAYNQEIGGVTLVQGPDGYYFVQTLNKVNLNSLPLSEVQSSIEAQLGQEKFQEAYDSYVEELRASATIINTLQ